MISFYKDYLNQGGKMDFKTFSNKYIPENFADGGVAGLLGERTRFAGGGKDASKSDFGKSKSSKRGRTDAQSQYGGTKGYQSSKNKSGRTTTTSGQGGGSGYTNTGGGGGGKPPSTNTGGETTTSDNSVNRGFLSDLRKKNQQKYLGILNRYKPDDFDALYNLNPTAITEEDSKFLNRYGVGKVYEDLSKTNIENFFDIRRKGVPPKKDPTSYIGDYKYNFVDSNDIPKFNFETMTGMKPENTLANTQLASGSNVLKNILKKAPDYLKPEGVIINKDINFFDNLLKLKGKVDYKDIPDVFKGKPKGTLGLEGATKGGTTYGINMDKNKNFNFGIKIPLGNRPKSKSRIQDIKNRFAPNNLGAGITSQVDTTNMLMADALTTPTEGKLGLNLMDYGTLKDSGYSDGQIEELQLNPKIDTQEVIRDIKGPIFAAADGGPARQNFKMGKRAFLKAMLGTGAGIAGLKSGLFATGGKKATKKAVTETIKQSAGSGTPPPYFFKLVEKIKTMGDDTLATTDKTISKKYKDYTMEEDFAGNIEIIKKGDDVAEDVYMSYKVDDVPIKGKKGSKKVEEYEEYTARPDAEGKMKDIEQGVPDEVVNEGSVFEDNMTEFGRTKKASGGIARMLGE